MTKFYYSGDRVRCVKPDDSGVLAKAEYVVQSHRRFPDTLILEGVEGQWTLDRFELVVEPTPSA